MCVGEERKMGKSSIEEIYDNINEVLEKADPQQMLRMTIPGMVLDKRSYVDDTQLEKPNKAAVNESHFTNKLSDDVSGVVEEDN